MAERRAARAEESPGEAEVEACRRHLAEAGRRREEAHRTASDARSELAGAQAKDGAARRTLDATPQPPDVTPPTLALASPADGDVVGASPVTVEVLLAPVPMIAMPLRDMIVFTSA